jgi:hypothetical protein
MRQSNTAAIKMDKDECRARDTCRRRTEAFGEPPHQRRLSGTEIAAEREHFAAAQGFANPFPDRDGLGRVG